MCIRDRFGSVISRRSTSTCQGLRMLGFVDFTEMAGSQEPNKLIPELSDTFGPGENLAA